MKDLGVKGRNINNAVREKTPVSWRLPRIPFHEVSGKNAPRTGLHSSKLLSPEINNGRKTQPRRAKLGISKPKWNTKEEAGRYNTRIQHGEWRFHNMEIDLIRTLIDKGSREQKLTLEDWGRMFARETAASVFAQKYAKKSNAIVHRMCQREARGKKKNKWQQQPPWPDEEIYHHC